MRIEIVGQPVEKPKPVLRLDLKQDDHGNVCLVSVDENGALYQYLLGIRTNGHTVLYSGIDPKFGLNLDRDNRLMMEAY